MNKKNSKSKINGKIIMMQNDLMNKLANIQITTKYSDELGFPTRQTQFDSLTNLINKAKTITLPNQEKIQKARNNVNKQVSTKRKSQKQSSTFLTGVGLYQQETSKPQPLSASSKQIHRNYYSTLNFQQNSPIIQEDPDLIIRQMLKKNSQDDLAELRRMINQTNQTLQDYGKQIHKTRKDVLNMADRFSKDVDYKLLDKIYRYDEKQY